MIVVECYLDEYLIRSLGFPKKHIKHQSGKGKVIRSLRKLQGKIGIIDEDPDSSQPSDLKNYDNIQQTENLRLLKKKTSKNQYLIVISPYLEGWIVKRANHNQIDMNKYGLESDARSLHNIPHIEEKTNFQNFLRQLISIDEEIKVLHEWVSKYMEN